MSVSDSDDKLSESTKLDGHGLSVAELDSDTVATSNFLATFLARREAHLFCLRLFLDNAPAVTYDNTGNKLILIQFLNQKHVLQHTLFCT